MANPNQPHNQQNRPQQQNPQHQQNRPQQQTKEPEVNTSTDNLRTNPYEMPHKEEEKLAEKIAENVAVDEGEVQFRNASEHWTHVLLEGIAKILNREATVPEVKKELLALFQNFPKTDRELIRADLSLTKIKNIVESLGMDINSITSEKW